MIKKKILKISILFFFVFSFFGSLSFASLKEERAANAMIKVLEYYHKRNWVGIIKQAYILYDWGEYEYVKRCLKMASPIIVAKKSPAGVLHLSFLYGKLKNVKAKDYWFRVYQNLKNMKRRRWKKS